MQNVLREETVSPNWSTPGTVKIDRKSLDSFRFAQNPSAMHIIYNFPRWFQFIKCHWYNVCMAWLIPFCYVLVHSLNSLFRAPYLGVETRLPGSTPLKDASKRDFRDFTSLMLTSHASRFVNWFAFQSSQFFVRVSNLRLKIWPALWCNILFLLFDFTLPLKIVRLDCQLH